MRSFIGVLSWLRPSNSRLAQASLIQIHKLFPIMRTVGMDWCRRPTSDEPVKTKT